MSQELLYHAFEVRGYDLAGVDCSEAMTALTLVPQAKRCRCSACGSGSVVRRGSMPRLIRLVPIGPQPVFAYLEVPRLECMDCGVVRQIELGFADPKKSYSQAFARYVLRLHKFTTIQDVSAGENRPTLAARWAQLPAAVSAGQWSCWNARGGKAD
jgi:transposase